MSRNQFVKNTLTAIQTQLNPSSPVISSSSADLTSYDDCSVRGGASEDNPDGGPPTVRSKRSDSITSWNSVSRDAVNGILLTPSSASAVNGGSTTSFQNGQDLGVSTSSQTYGKAWESEMESLLKVRWSFRLWCPVSPLIWISQEMYNAIKSQQILQPQSFMGRSSLSSLSPDRAGVMRNRSLRTGQQDRLTTLKRGSIRGLQSILSAQSGASPYSSNSSITDGRVSPSPSFATSQHEVSVVHLLDSAEN